MKRTVLLLLLAALALPASAAAQKIDVKGPMALHGQWRVLGELQSENADAGVRIRAQGGLFRFTDLAGDLKVKCEGRGEQKVRKNDQGQTVVVCAGRKVGALVSGSHFGIAGFAFRYGMLIPEGYSGTLQGHFRVKGDNQPTDRPKRDPKPAERPGSDQQPGAQQGADPLDDQQQAQADLDELASDLAAQG